MTHDEKELDKLWAERGALLHEVILSRRLIGEMRSADVMQCQSHHAYSEAMAKTDAVVGRVG